MTLSTIIKTRLQQEGAIPFVDFMQLCLYHPQWGYYSSGTQKFGPQGDFVTAPELTPLFGYTLANQCQQVLCTLKDPVIFEFGAGSGRLCVDLLTQLERTQNLPVGYQILEVSADLRQRQKKRVEEEIPHLAHLVTWLDRWPERPFIGVIIANEVLDAMPVHRFLQTENGLQESVVSLSPAGELCETFRPIQDQRLAQFVQTTLADLPQPYLSEVNLFAASWIQQCSDMLQQGALFALDYGFPRHEYYHPDRNQGTLMCHYQHQAHSNPLLHPGLQDITAHVDFTLIAEAADAAGLEVTGYTNQAAFLLANGLLNLLEDIDDDHKRINAQQAVKQLLHPSEMGELFKVIALTKGLDLELNGFQWHDKRASL